MGEVRGKKIFVGLSGGVDSAVSAALLKDAGAEVTGVCIKGWYPEGMHCTWTNERRDAMRVAARLHIPFITFDASAEYKKSVVDYLLTEYRAGRTPNPDVMCNREVKFGVFYRFALDSGADAIAMGHYRSGEKDQSYFLWAVPKYILEATIFPIGNMQKEKVRKLAKKFNLPVAEKKDSQGVCFLGNVSIKEFLRRELGTDNPALLYTIGQKIEGGYVVGKDIENKKLLVNRSIGTSTEIEFQNPNWFGDMASATESQYRYRGPKVRGRIENARFVATQTFPDIPAPGQSVVFYTATGEMVGGGIIAV